MSSSYGSVSFKVVGERGTYPTITRDADGLARYSATIRLASLSARNALAALESRATVKRIYGRLDGVIHLEGGPGAATLVVPTIAGTLGSRSAVLVALTNIRADGTYGSGCTADAEWVIVS